MPLELINSLALSCLTVHVCDRDQLPCHALRAPQYARTHARTRARTHTHTHTHTQGYKLDLKATSYKQLSKFLTAMEKKKLLKCKKVCARVHVCVRLRACACVCV